MNTTAPTLADVTIEQNADGLTVWTTWNGVDDPNGYGVALPNNANGLALARRFEKAIRAGRAWTARVGTKNNGETYAQLEAHFLARQLNADLRRMGF